MTHHQSPTSVTGLLLALLIGLGLGPASGQEKLTDAAKGELLPNQIAAAKKYVKKSEKQLDKLVKLFEEPAEWTEGAAQSEMWGVTREWLDSAHEVSDDLEQIDMSADEPLAALSPAVKAWWMANFRRWKWLDTEGYNQLDEHLQLIDFARRCRKDFIPDVKKVYGRLKKLGKEIDDHLGEAKEAVRSGDAKKAADALRQLELDIHLAGAIDGIVDEHIKETLKFRASDPTAVSGVADPSTWFSDWGLDAGTDPVFWAAKEKIELSVAEAIEDRRAAWDEVMDLIDPIFMQGTPFADSEFKHIRGWENEKMRETLQKEYDALAQ